MVRMITDENGNPIPSSAVGSDMMQVSAVADGVIENAAALLEPSSFTWIASNEDKLQGALGWIPLLGCPVIHIIAKLTKGSLTDASIYPEFGYLPAAGGTILTGYRPIVPAAPSSGIITADDLLKFTMTTNGIGTIFTIQNPGAHYVRLYIMSTGTTTSSAFLINLMRGFNNHIGYVA